jgi:hypothetical protein
MVTDKHIKLMETARQYIGTHHDAKGNKLIEKWLASVNRDLYINDTEYTAYCAAFVSQMLAEADISNKVYKSAGSLEIWNKTPKELRVQKAYKGCLFVWDFGGGKGHIGFCDTELPNNKMLTIEGNTKNPNIKNEPNVSERDGGWVYQRERTNLITKIGAINILGFIDPYKL